MSMTNRVEAFSVSHAQILTAGQSFLESIAQAALAEEDIYGVAEAGLSPDLGSYDNEGDDSIMSTWDWINKAELTVKAGYVSFPLLSAITGQPIDTITEAAAVNAVQTIPAHDAESGTFTLSYDGQTTSALDWDSTAGEIDAALEALSTIPAGGVTVSGGPINTTAVVVTFAGDLAGQAVEPITSDDALLVGGTLGATVQTTPGSGANKAGFAMDLWHEDAAVSAPRPMIIKMPSKDENGVPADFVIGLYKVQFKPITFDGPAYRDGLKVNYDGNALQSAVDELGAAFSDGKKRFGRLLAIQR